MARFWFLVPGAMLIGLACVVVLLLCVWHGGAHMLLRHRYDDYLEMVENFA